MFRTLFNLFKTAGRKARGQASPVPLRLEELESRQVPSSVPLHVADTQLADPNGNVVVLRGVNISGLESFPTGLSGDSSQVLKTVDVALNDWHANLLRVTVYSDFWFGHDEGAIDGNGNSLGEVDPTAYRKLIDQIVAKASEHGAYVMLTEWGSDMGNVNLRPDLRDLPDYGTQAFWQDAATHRMQVDAQGNAVANGPSYANNPALMFDLFNEPHDDGSGQVGWNEWLNGGKGFQETSKEGVTRTYDSPGMQGLLTTIRNAKANNIVAAEGLGYSADFSGIGAGFGLKDVKSNLMYELHLYPAQWQSATDGDALVQQLGGLKVPVYVGEFGTPYGADDPASGVNGVPLQGATQWTKDMLAWLHQHNYSWTAWSMSADTAPVLIQDYVNYTPTPYFGAVVKADLANSAALDSLGTALQYATFEYNYALATNSPSLGAAEASYEYSSLAYFNAQGALSTQSADAWATAEQNALTALGFALADASNGNPYAGIASGFDASFVNLAVPAPFYGSV
jgi:hypothetical protein